MKRPAISNAVSTLERVASTLATRRKELGLTEDQIATAAGLSRTRIIKIERQLAENVRLSTLARLATALNLDVLDFFVQARLGPHHLIDQPPADRVVSNVLRLRSESDYSQTDLSLAAGHFRTYVNRLEGARIDPTLSALADIAEALGVAIAALLEPLGPSRSAVAKRIASTAETRIKPAASATVSAIAMSLRRRREALGWSQEVTAETCGLSRSSYVHLEQAVESNPRLFTLRCLADGLETDILDLVEPLPTGFRPRSDQDPALRLTANLFRLRKAAGLSQVELSTQSDHFKRYITDIERLRANPPIGSLMRIAACLDVSVVNLLAPISASQYRALADAQRSGERLALDRFF
ncbi:helix-turn-helix domain-containing protein [Paraburkholderia caribensis]|uniref:helix-turn-helix domain-containing protein n=1 Tax=Paraburkholderia caribensis TaxID=75105 RepID=UPI0034D2A192